MPPAYSTVAGSLFADVNFPAIYTHPVRQALHSTVAGSYFADMNFPARYTDLVHIVTITS